MNNSRLPPVPKDVTAALELLPRAVIDEINLKGVISGGLRLLQNPTKPLTEEEWEEHLISGGFERMRLIRLAVEELGLKEEVDALCGSRSDGTRP
jgi:hypothetical protein